MRASTVLFITLLALAVPPSAARGETYIADKNGLMDRGATAPRGLTDVLVTGTLGSHGGGSVYVRPGLLQGSDSFQSPPSCLCTPQGSSSGQAALNADDFYISGPPGVVHGVVHMQLEGVMAHAGDNPWSAAVEVSAYPQGSFASGSMAFDPDGSIVTAGVLTGAGGPYVNAALDFPFDISTGYNSFLNLRLQTSAGGGSFGTGSNSSLCDFFADTDGDGIGGFHFILNGPAISLPAGYSVTSPLLGIVDNYWNSPATSAAPEPPAAVGGFGLSLAPNPVASRTTLRYDLPRNGAARVEIFDIAGRSVRELQVGEQAAGPHDIAWDARDAAGRPLPAGLYLARVESGGRSQVAKVMLLGTAR